MQCFYCLLCILTTTSVSSSTTSCNDLTSLVEALYSTDDNLFRLAQVFYPLRQPPAIYVTVTYRFQNESETGKLDCSINYIWASSSFLLVQPPHVFQWTSLLFYHQSASEHSNITLILPAACKHLAPNCSCEYQGEDNMLHFMTHQVLYV